MGIAWMGVLYLVAIACFVLVGIELGRRGGRRLDGGTGFGGAAPSGMDGHAEGAGETEIRAYLDRLTAELHLPAGDVAEVRAELVDHLRDSIASLEAEGLGSERATREALARLGAAQELGRQIRRAHQSGRRLLAGVGGGVFAGGSGFVFGYIAGAGLAIVAAVAIYAAVAALAALGLRLPDLGLSRTNASQPLFVGFGLSIAAFMTTRSAVRTCAGLSRRTPRSVATPWLFAGALAFGGWALFGLRGPQSWPGVAAELFIPLAAVAGAVVRVDRPIARAGRGLVALGVVAIVVAFSLFALAVGHAGSSSGPVAFQTPDLHLDVAAPAAPLQWAPEGISCGGGSGSDPVSSGTLVDVTPCGSSGAPIVTTLANWHDLRFEAWRAAPFDGQADGLGIDPRYESPMQIQTAVVGTDSISAVFHLERVRDAGPWWIVLTAVGPDGHRYRLDNGSGGESPFDGSVWDWLTASGG